MLCRLSTCVVTAREDIMPDERFKKFVGLGLVTFFGLSRDVLVDEEPGDDVAAGPAGLALGFAEVREVAPIFNCFLSGRVVAADIDLFT